MISLLPVLLRILVPSGLLLILIGAKCQGQGQPDVFYGGNEEIRIKYLFFPDGKLEMHRSLRGFPTLVGKGKYKKEFSWLSIASPGDAFYIPRFDLIGNDTLVDNLNFADLSRDSDHVSHFRWDICGMFDFNVTNHRLIPEADFASQVKVVSDALRQNPKEIDYLLKENLYLIYNTLLKKKTPLTGAEREFMRLADESSYVKKPSKWDYVRAADGSFYLEDLKKFLTRIQLPYNYFLVVPSTREWLDMRLMNATYYGTRGNATETLTFRVDGYLMGTVTHGDQISKDTLGYQKLGDSISIAGWRVNENSDYFLFQPDGRLLRGSSLQDYSLNPDHNSKTRWEIVNQGYFATIEMPQIDAREYLNRVRQLTERFHSAAPSSLSPDEHFCLIAIYNRQFTGDESHPEQPEEKSLIAAMEKTGYIQWVKKNLKFKQNPVKWLVPKETVKRSYEPDLPDCTFLLSGKF